MLKQCREDLYVLKNDDFAEHMLGFFKTGPGEYGEGDCFLGIRMPEIRKLARKYRDIDLKSLESLIESKWHEERMLGLIILLIKYEREKKEDDLKASRLFKLYIKKKKYINNWDLVDVTCPRVIGAELLKGDRELLYRWAASRDLWTRRLSIISTLYFIKNNDFKDTMRISELLLNDKHDLMHKAVGWCLREVGKKDRTLLDKFLKKYQLQMPRTMLRYAIEKHPEKVRKKILAGKF